LNCTLRQNQEGTEKERNRNGDGIRNSRIELERKTIECTILRKWTKKMYIISSPFI
jgi:hypothetical protein